MPAESRLEPSVHPGAAPAHHPWLDNLRVACIAGVVVAHVATAYVVDVSWYYEDRTGSEAVSTALTFPVFLGAIFGLGPLFVVAGMLSARSLARKGPGAFVRSRLLRLGVPTVVFVLLVDPVADWLGDLPEPGTVPLADYLTDATGTRDLGPMWFVAALLGLSLLYAAWRSVRPGEATTAQRVSGPQLAGVAALIAVMAWVVWLRWSLVDETPFNLNVGHWGQATGLFLLGVGAGERGWLTTLTWRRARRLGWVALAGAGVVVGLAGLVLAQDDFGSMTGGVHWQSMAFAVAIGVTSVAASLWVLAWFSRRWDHAGPLMVKAGRGSYAAYVIHPVVLVLASLALHTAPLAPELKLVVVAALAVPATFAAGYGLTRLPGLRRVL